ncbi:putative allantoate deiminase [Rosa chinensis]|uniref:Putative allantoate deiminase n=1 Tax=Rosa chinensis TaxID=74649 RepID=A0A2P6S7D3_ROSCH|nr:putative allantoate deiminase [Rosa chinensis]
MKLCQEILRDEAVSDGDGYLERIFMSPAAVRAGNLIHEWMEDAGLRTWVDCLGNVHGRLEGTNASAEVLILGSHLVLSIDGKLGELKRPVEVIAFSDEERVRFQSTFIGSAAIAGILPVSGLQITDKSGVTIQDAPKKISIEVTEEHLQQLRYDPKSVWGYVEIHIEQGPVLEWVGVPLGVVKGIAGQTRLKHDANAVICDSELTSKLKSAAYLGLKRMTGSVQDEVPVLMSGAGYDAMALSHLTKVGMLFVLCRGGISHFPEEHVLDDDVWASGLEILAFIETQL